MNIVELTGPTGAGKSAIYQHMLKRGGFIPNPSAETLDDAAAQKLIEAALEKMTGLGDFVSLLNYIFRTAERDRVDIRRRGTLRALAKVLIARGRPDITETLVVDGGLIHRGWGIARLEPPMPLVRYYETMPTPDLVVNVRCDPEVIKQRNRERGGSHDRSEHIDKAVEVANMAAEIMEGRGVTVFDVDTTETPPEENAARIMKALGFETAVPASRSFSGQAAKDYDAKRETQDKWHAEQRIVTDMLSDLPEGSTVLDVPCGTGRFFGTYAEKGFVVRGMDREADMIAQAAKKVPDPTAMIGDRKQWGFIHGDIREGIPLDDQSVDAAVMVRLTRWLSPQECQNAMRELQRVTRGRIVLTARVANHPYARPAELFEAVLEPEWTLARNEEGHEPDYRVLMFERVA